ncbi:hypothetical protein FB2170_07499 [Maribacter sp. HTCC2170]|nr:hypothetical protein FB2170_07499 [Maribacter sp. HTCC2170]
MEVKLVFDSDEVMLLVFEQLAIINRSTSGINCFISLMISIQIY